jgi:polysaccharide deacetylase 2 family uncharacterized protein YibQ
MSGARRNRLRYRISLYLFLLLLPLPAVAADSPPVIAIIIDDVGNHLDQGEAALELPGPVTLSFLPHTPHARDLAKRAHARGKEIMLHLPMDSYAGNRLGPGALTLHMTRIEFLRTLHGSLDAVPHVVGLNNHMGSLLTRHPGAMGWLMEGVKAYGDLYFIDSRTTTETVAEGVAQEYAVPVTRRNVFLDNDRSPRVIRNQFRQLLDQARREGAAIGIGHPYPETIAVLKRELGKLEASGSVRLIPASQLIQLQRRSEPWLEPSSPSPKVVKNLKPSP